MLNFYVVQSIYIIMEKMNYGIFGIIFGGLLIFSLILLPGIVSAENFSMSVNKTAGVSTAEIGDVIEYEVVVRNSGNEILYNVNIDDILPYGMHFIDKSLDPVCSDKEVGARIGAKIGARIGAKIGAKVGECYPETRYEVYLEPATWNEEITTLFDVMCPSEDKNTLYFQIFLEY